MGAFEQVELTRAVNECWLIDQAFAGNLAALEADQCPAAARGQAGIAELAGRALARIGKVVGGASYSGSGPFGQWAQEVRPLGFRRPPGPLASDNLLDMSWTD